MKYITLERVAWVLTILLLSIMFYNIGAKLGSTHTIEHVAKPPIVDTITKDRNAYTEAKVDTSIKPMLLIDTLKLDDIMSDMFVAFESRPVYDDKHNLKYLTKWTHNIAVITELTQNTDTLKIIEQKINWNLLGYVGAGGCLAGGGTALYILNILTR